MVHLAQIKDGQTSFDRLQSRVVKPVVRFKRRSGLIGLASGASTVNGFATVGPPVPSVIELHSSPPKKHPHTPEGEEKKDDSGTTDRPQDGCVTKSYRNVCPDKRRSGAKERSLKIQLPQVFKIGPAKPIVPSKRRARCGACLSRMLKLKPGKTSLMHKAHAIAAAVLLSVSACATPSGIAESGTVGAPTATYQNSPALSAQVNDLRDRIASMRGEPLMEPDSVNDLIETIDAPLGSPELPVRAAMPAGQRAYLNRLRCSDGTPPTYHRQGMAGVAPYGTIVDLYIVECKSAEPRMSEIHIDMYHDHVEAKAVPGFTIVPPATLNAI